MPAPLIDVVPVCPAANVFAERLVVDAFAKFAVPVKVGFAEKTTEPVPVSSERSTARAEDDASDDDASFVLKVVQSAAVRRPRLSALDDGILKVKVLLEVLIEKSVPLVVEANVCTIAPDWPLTVMTPPAARHVPLTAKQPVAIFTPFAMVVVPEPETEKSVVVPALPEVDDAIAKIVFVFARPELS